MIYDEDGVRLYHGDAVEVLASLPAESVDCVVTSPPYWGLRAYSGEQVRAWGGDPDCPHEFTIEPTRVITGGMTEKQVTNAGSFVSAGIAGSCRCGAWEGGYGAEPTPELYVGHTVEVLRAIRRVLKPSGVVWWNVGDSYASVASGNNGRAEFGSTLGGGPQRGSMRGDASRFAGRAVRHQAQGRTSQRRGRANVDAQRMERGAPGLKPKDMVLIPFRVALAAQADGWWVRSDVIWAKPNPMPESVTDRPTKAHEYVFLLTKSERYFWDQDAVRERYAETTLGDRRFGDEVLAASKRVRNVGGRTDGYTTGGGCLGDPSAAGRNIRSVWTIATQPSPLPHFAAFPDELAERCIKAACPSDGVVLDPFAGTGTTLKVARQLGRKAIGIEISRDYCELAVQRLRYGTRGTLAVRQGQGTLWEGG